MTHNRKIIIILAVAAVLSAGILILGVFPLMNSVRTLTTEVYDKRVKLATVVKEQENFIVLSKNFDNVSSQIQSLDSLIVKSNESLTFISALERYADEAGVTIDLDLAELEASNEIQIVPVALQASGTFQHILSFVQKLDASPYYLLVTTVRMSRLADDTLEILVQGNTYWVEKEL